MLDGRRAGEGQSGRFRIEGGQSQHERHAAVARYTHILVPTSLASTDRAALLLGFELAAAHGATVTVLHVLAANDFPPSSNGLDALGFLHRAAFELRTQPATRAAAIEMTQADVSEFVERVVPERMRATVDVRAECRRGEIPERIARFADEADADLVILSTRPPRWWLPLLPFRVRRVLQLTSRQVVVTRRSTKTNQKLHA